MLRVLTYHRIDDLVPRPALNPSLISATPDLFARQIDHLRRNYSVVGIQDVLDAIGGRTALPERAVLITFDDGYRDFKTHALPALRRFNLPGVLFVPTAYPDDPGRVFWWDRLYRAVMYTPAVKISGVRAGTLMLQTEDLRRRALRTLRDQIKSMPHAEAMALLDSVCQQIGDPETSEPAVLGWDELREVERQGVALAAHTRTHPILTNVTPEQAHAEVRGSRRDLERETGGALPVFSYPNGSVDPTVMDILREEGFVLAFTTMNGTNEIEEMDEVSRLMLYRMNIGLRTTLPLFRLRLMRAFNLLDTWLHKKKGQATWQA